MKSLHIARRCARYLMISVVVAMLLPTGPAFSQSSKGETAPPPSEIDAPRDPLGRDTPRGTLLGFMRTARDGNFEAAFRYLNTPLSGKPALELARRLYVVLDSRLPVRLVDVSDRPEGSRANPLRPDQDVVGAISTANGQLELTVERVTNGPMPVWMFSRRTLDAIPDVYSEINLITLDRYLPEWIGRPRIAGIRVFEFFALLLVPLCYQLIGLVRVPGYARLLILAVSIRSLLGALDLPLSERKLWSTVAAMLILAALLWILLRANLYGERYVRTRLRNSALVEVASMVRLGRRILDVLIVVAVGLVGLKYFGVDPTAALAGLGIGGVAVALAAQKTLENVIGGLSLIFDKAVRVGDLLKLGDVVGTVDSIGLRSTRVRTLDRTILTIPNGQVANVSIETISARDMHWFRHILGLRYETTPAQLRYVLDGIRARLAASSAVDSGSIRVRLFRFGHSSLDIEIFAYVLTHDWLHFMEIQERLLVAITEIVEASGTTIALPSQTLHIADGEIRRLAPTAATREPDSGVAVARRLERPSANA